MNARITVTWFWVSSSDPAKQYQTLVYDNGSTSCDCPGWTRRNPPGGRTCKHTRAVEAGSDFARALGGRCKTTPVPNPPFAPDGKLPKERKAKPAAAKEKVSCMRLISFED